MMKALSEHKDMVDLFLKPALVLLVGLVVIICMVVLGLQHLNHKPAQQQHAVVLVASKPTQKPVVAAESAASEVSEPASAPAEVAVAHTSASQPVSVPAPTPVAAPVPAPVAAATITISADGCTVTGTGTPGMAFNVGSTNGRKGGDSHYVLPASGTRTVHTGSIKGFTVYGQILGAANAQLAYATSTVTAVSCPPADAEQVQ